MDQHDRGMGPEIKRYFRKIINSFVAGAVWLLFMSTLGLFLRMGYVRKGFDAYNIVFYVLFLISFPLLLRFVYRTWRKKD